MQIMQARSRDGAARPMGLWGGSGCVGWQSGKNTKKGGMPNRFYPTV